MKKLIIALFLLLSVDGAIAGEVIKCTDASGRTTFSDQPCSSGKSSTVDVGSPAQSKPAANATDDATVAGKIDFVEGDVRILDSKNKSRTVRVDDKIYERDSVVTGANGELHLTMEDGGYIAVRPNTRMRIIQYRAQGDDQDAGVIGLLVGSLRSISGWIGKYHPQSYAIRTKTATIGIRGTDHEPMVIPEGSSEGEPGTYDKVNVGGSYIKTAQGQVDITPQHAGFAPHGGKPGQSQPRLLASVPHFFRPARNEHLIEGKHAAIQRSVEKLREDRRQKVNERRQSGHNQAAAPRQEKLRADTSREARKNKLEQMRQERQQQRQQRQAHQQQQHQQRQAQHQQREVQKEHPRLKKKSGAHNTEDKN